MALETGNEFRVRDVTRFARPIDISHFTAFHCIVCLVLKALLLDCFSMFSQKSVIATLRSYYIIHRLHLGTFRAVIAKK